MNTKHKIRMKTQPKQRQYSTENYNKVKPKISNWRLRVQSWKTLGTNPESWLEEAWFVDLHLLLCKVRVHEIQSSSSGFRSFSVIVFQVVFLHCHEHNIPFWLNTLAHLLQSTGSKDPLIFLWVKFSPKKDVAANGSREHPRLLGCVG